MSSVLDEICAKKREHIAAKQEDVPAAALNILANSASKPRGFARALKDRVARGEYGLIAEIKGRYAKISGYEGEVTYTINDGQAITEDAELLTLRDYISTAYDMRVVEFASHPKDSEITPLSSRGTIEKGVMDFSGVSFKFGVAYHF